MKTEYTILCMNIGQPSQLKYQWDIFTCVSEGWLYPNVEQKCPDLSPESRVVCARM